MKISCIVSTYNRAKHFLPQCIDSILKQTEPDFELIIVDDASTDNTKKVVSKYKDPRIQYIRLDENSGSDTKPKNEGTKRSMGRYLMFVDDDVTLNKDAFETLSRHLDMTDNDVVYGDMMLVKPDGKEEPGIRSDFNAQFLLLRNYIDTSVAMMRREAMFWVGGWDQTLPKFVDWNLWVRMMKGGLKFERVHKYVMRYFIHEDTKSNRVKTEMYMHPKLGELFVPTFDTAGCSWRKYYLSKIKQPIVCIYTMHYDRLDYSKKTYKSMKDSAGYPFRWYCVDNGSKDGTKEWLTKLRDKGEATVILNDKNEGITKSSNMLLDEIARSNPDIIIKIDNDVEFQTKNWLKDLVALWRRNTMFYMSPYVEGLVDNPGGAQRIGYTKVNEKYLEVTRHIGGIFAMIDARAYDDFRWSDKMLHGNQDMEASQYFITKGYMPCYFPQHRIAHMDTTEGQHKKYKKYFKRRLDEKTTEA